MATNDQVVPPAGAIDDSAAPAPDAPETARQRYKQVRREGGPNSADMREHFDQVESFHRDQDAARELRVAEEDLQRDREERERWEAEREAGAGAPDPRSLPFQNRNDDVDPTVQQAALSVDRYRAHDELRREIEAGVGEERAAEISAEQHRLGGDVYSAHQEMRERVGGLSDEQRQDLAEHYPDQAGFVEAHLQETGAQTHQDLQHEHVLDR
ncbi:MAG: hypothetical protein AB1941_16795 [Gemmatimonadota bacterium]